MQLLVLRVRVMQPLRVRVKVRVMQPLGVMAVPGREAVVNPLLVAGVEAQVVIVMAGLAAVMGVMGVEARRRFQSSRTC